MAINCISLIGKSQSGQFWGDGNTGRWKTTRVVEVTGYGTLPVLSPSGHLEQVTINGVSLGEGRIISVEAVGGQEFGGRDLFNQKFKATIEMFVDGSVSDTELPVIADLSFLESFSENFSIEGDEQAGYRYTHSLTIKYIKANNGFDPIAAAKDAAEIIFEDSSYDATIDSLGKSFTYARVGRKFFTEKYDTKTNECSFEKSYSLLDQNTSVDYTLSLSSRVSISDIGAILVEEKGDILGLDGFDSATSGMDTEIADSFARCDALFTATFSLASGLADTLVDLPIQILKSFNSQAETASYTVVYTNNKNLDIANLIIFEQTETFGKDGDVPSITYDGKITSFDKKNASFDPASLIEAKVPATPAGYKLQSKKFSAAKFGKQISFTYSFTTDPTFYTSGAFRKLSISAQDTIGIRVHKEFQIPNSLVLIHDLGLTSLSKRVVTVESIITRTNSSVMTAPPVLPLTTLKNAAVAKCLSFIAELGVAAIDNNMVSFQKLSYNFNSSRALKMTLEMDYVVVKGSLTEKILE